MRYTVWALLLILTTNTSGQGRRQPEDADHRALPITEPQLNSLATVSPAQPMAGGSYSAPVGSGKISLDELRIPPKAIHELQLSVKAYRTGDWRASAIHLEKVLAIYPQYYPAQDALGTLYVRLHEYDKALGEFEKTTNPESRSPQELHNLSATLYLLKRYSEAESTARAALQIDPMRTTTRYVLGCTLFAEGLITDETVDLLKQSSQTIPNARLVLAHLLIKRGVPDEAETELRAYLEAPNAPGKDEVRRWLDELTHESADQAK